MALKAVTGGTAERRSGILACACRVIARDGAQGLRMSAVAAEAGVSSALLHYYFATREELVRQAFEYHELRETARGRDRLAAIADPAERVRDALVHELREDADVREGWILWGELQQLSIHDESLRGTVIELARDWVGGIAELVAAAQSAGAIAVDVDARAAGLRLASMAEGLGWHVLVGSLSRAEAVAALDAAIGLELGIPVGGRT